MKYYLIAGEASGDLHGANLMREIINCDPEASFRFFGGGLMQEVGGNQARDYRELAFMGMIDVLRNIRTIKKNLDFCKKDILDFCPDVVILIDYPGFNLKIAAFAKRNDLKVFYYISPKIWAWKEWRLKKIKAFVDEMFTILPFEKEFYARHNYKVHYVGNPLLDEIESFRSAYGNDKNFRKENNLDNRPLVALLAGSRKPEIKLMLPVMKQIAAEYPEFQFVISGAPSMEREVYDRLLGDARIPVVYNQTYRLLTESFAALVTSGTATLETALLNVPQVVLYKIAGGGFAYKIFRFFFLKVPYVSLPNLILGEQVVSEFIMDKMKFRFLRPEVEKLLKDQSYRGKIFDKYALLKKITGGPGASKRAAHEMTELLK